MLRQRYHTVEVKNGLYSAFMLNSYGVTQSFMMHFVLGQTRTKKHSLKQMDRVTLRVSGFHVVRKYRRQLDLNARIFLLSP